MAEKQAAHRQALEKKVITSDVWRSWAGLIVGGVLAMTLIVSGSFLIYHGHDWAGAAIITSIVVTLAGTFVTGTVSRQRERAAKEQAVKGKKR